jgi:hypothetical protein
MLAIVREQAAQRRLVAIITEIRVFVGEPVLVKARIKDDLPDVLG